jgi:Lon protease-like protein
MEESLLPLFPLEVVLLPEELLPLHIFEDRYKQMIGARLEAKAANAPGQEFGVVFAREQEIQTMGCTAAIVNVTRKYSDGSFDILAIGRRRFELLFTREEKPCLEGAVVFFDDDGGADTPAEEAAQHAIDRFRMTMQRLHRNTDIPIHLPRPYRYLSYRIAGPLPLEADFKQQLLSMRDETERLRHVLRAMDALIRHCDLLKKAQEKAGGNGDIHGRS